MKTVYGEGRVTCSNGKIGVIERRGGAGSKRGAKKVPVVA
jgi:hypothetical protein